MPITLYTWNVNGIRAMQRKGFTDWLATTQPDILGIQETKAAPEQLDADLLAPPGYNTYWATSTVKKGYSGVALYTRLQPEQVQVGLGIEAYDREGRTIIAHYTDFVFVTAYFPSGATSDERFAYKMAYKDAFTEVISGLRTAGKPVIFCGDINIAHQPIDLSYPERNTNTVGFLPEERAWLDEITAAGYIDIYRHRNPDRAGAYSWWSYRTGARQRNIGWRLDYFFITPDLLPVVQDTALHPHITGSDHCPVSLTLNL